VVAGDANLTNTHKESKSETTFSADADANAIELRKPILETTIDGLD
jgi:hypothetical protein